MNLKILQKPYPRCCRSVVELLAIFAFLHTPLIRHYLLILPRHKKDFLSFLSNKRQLSPFYQLFIIDNTFIIVYNGITSLKIKQKTKCKTMIKESGPYNWNANTPPARYAGTLSTPATLWQIPSAVYALSVNFR